jgi:hypothetical protein
LAKLSSPTTTALASAPAWTEQTNPASCSAPCRILRILLFDSNMITELSVPMAANLPDPYVLAQWHGLCTLYIGMIDITANNAVYGPYQPAPDSAPGRKVLRMVENDRTAGSMPTWVDASVGDAFANQLDNTGQSQENSFRTALAESGEAATNEADEPFGFYDLLDMVNPLQHIPVVNQLYRDLTGDSIKPVAQVIGGGVFGGPAGAAGGLVNVIIEEETGKDLAGNAVAFALHGESPKFRSNKNDSPAERLESVIAQAETRAYNDLPAELLAFAATPEPVRQAKPMLHNDNSRYNS